MGLEIDTDTTPAEERARELANSFGKERVDGFTDKIFGVMEEVLPPEVQARVKKEIGGIVAVAYFHGYIDRHEGKKLKRLYV